MRIDVAEIAGPGASATNAEYPYPATPLIEQAMLGYGIQGEAGYQGPKQPSSITYLHARARAACQAYQATRYDVTGRLLPELIRGIEAASRMNGAAPLSAQIAETKAASVALFRRDGTALREMQERTPGFFAQLGRAVPVPVLAGAGAMLIQRRDAVLGALAVSGGMAPGQDDECAEAALAVLAPQPSPERVQAK